MNRSAFALALAANVALTTLAAAQPAPAAPEPSVAAPGSADVPPAPPADVAATPPSGADQAAPPSAPAEVAAPSTAAADPLGAIPEGKGRVVFFRPGSMLGMAIPCPIHDGPGDVARLWSGRYAVYIADAGSHRFMTQSEAKDFLTLEVEPGETYYLSCTMSMGMLVYRPNLSPSSQVAFDAKAKGLKLVEPKEAKPPA